MKNILFISYDGMTDPLGQSQVIPYLIGLTKYGFRFTILSCDKSEKFKLYANDIYAILKPYPIKWVSVPYHKNPPVFSSIFDTLLLKRKAVKLHLKEHFDLVHTRAGTPALIGLWLKKKYGIKFLNDLRDFYANSRVDSGSWDQKNIVYKKVFRFFKKKESEAIRLNDGIVCLTRAAEKIIKNLAVYNSAIPLKVIPCSVDLELFNPLKIDPLLKETFQKELKIEEGDIIFSYLGSIGGWYLTEEMMLFCKSISDKIPRAKFLFITPHPSSEIVKKAMNYGIIPDKILIKQAQRNEVPVLLSFSSYSLFFIKPCYSKQASSPTKHGEIMAMGIPLITNKGVGDVSELVNKYKSGIVLDSLENESYLRTSIQIAEGIAFNREEIRQGAHDYYNLLNAITKYKEIYNQILLP